MYPCVPCPISISYNVHYMKPHYLPFINPWCTCAASLTSHTNLSMWKITYGYFSQVCLAHWNVNAHEYDTWFLTHAEQAFKRNLSFKPLTNAHTALSWFWWSSMYWKVIGAFLIAFIILPSPAVSNAFYKCTRYTSHDITRLQNHWWF